ncbi:MAG: carboxy terminal-processing peptidase [Chthoniobacteraceae bacterium]|nr:carboxy terminal-processing peptidase [Chthoniobacteraceae bacterium]
MKLFRTLCTLLTASALLATATPRRAGAEPDPSQVTSSIGRVLEQFHYSRHKLDDDISKRTLLRYLETLDYAHLVFTQQDIDAFVAKYGDALDDDIVLGNPTPVYEIFDLYKKRIEGRVAKVKEWLASEKFTFKSDRSLVLNRTKAPWPKDEAEAEQLWHDRLEGEYLTLKLADKQAEPPVKVLTRRYDNLLRTAEEQTNRDAVDQFLFALTQTYDPHSEYMSKDEYQNFLVMMKLSLVGIGAVLKKNDDGYTKIMELVVGGPADKEGHLKVGDRIVAVAQGDSDFVEIVDMKLDKVVNMIRGKKGTRVRLQIIPSHASDPSARKIIEIVRDEVKIKDQEAKAYIIEKPDPASGKPYRIGWITLPGFYGDMEGSKSTTEDVRALLKRLKQEHISGLVIDIRRNGGGYLTEATKLTGLFIKRGPVVQVKDANGKIDVLSADEANVTYDGPLVILTSTLSASASEIFAGALQDYGRAVIVGDHHTFGKGTVQQLIPVDRFIQLLSGASGDAGALKLTIQKFYRVAGGSTQFRGVASDVVLPSFWDRDDIGESALKNPLPYDEVPPADYRKSPNQPLFLDELRSRSTARVNANPEFKYINDDIVRLKEISDENKFSLNEQTRRAEIAKQKALKEKRLTERAKRKPKEMTVYALTLDNLDKPLELAKNDGKKRVEQWMEMDQATKDKLKAEAAKEAQAEKAADAKNEKKDEKKESKKDAKKPESESADADALDDDDPDNGDNANAPVIDPIRAETLNITSDLIDLRKIQNTPNTARAAQQ